MERMSSEAHVETTQIERGQGDGAQFVDQLASRVGGSARAEIVYGVPVERGSVTVIPVARVRYGFGGGRGTNQERARGEGSGGGGGAKVTPAGFIEVREDGAVFHPIRDRASEQRAAAVMFAFLGFGAFFLLRGIGALIR